VSKLEAFLLGWIDRGALDEFVYVYTYEYMHTSAYMYLYLYEYLYVQMLDVGRIVKRLDKEKRRTVLRVRRFSKAL
jgi:hypothetical protein